MLELLMPAEMAEADRLTIQSGVTGLALMNAAGTAVADVVASHAAPGAQVRVVAGPGNNGGDGYVAARVLAQRGYRVDVLCLAPPVSGYAVAAAAEWHGPTAPAATGAVEGADIIIDAMFGAGLKRPLDGAALLMVGAINCFKGSVIAVDLPSGISGETSEVLGAAVEATATATFFRKKPGHVLLPGRLHCGEITVAQIGIEPGVLSTIQPRTFLNRPPLWQGCYPVPTIEGHKYTRGHAVVVSGGLSSTGAARLAARGALRAGAGLVTVAAPLEAVPIVAADSLAVMVRAVEGPAGLGLFLQDKRLNAVVLGPGGGVGPEMRHMVEIAMAGERGVVLDADALISFAGDVAELQQAIGQENSNCVLTPHEGEFMRLFGNCPDILASASKLARTGAAAASLGAVVVLKGADTVVAAPDGRATIADNAPPWLATAGAGDVLAGMIGGLLAQGMPAFEAAAAGVWVHGEAAQTFGPGLISEDIPEALPAVLRKLLQSFA